MPRRFILGCFEVPGYGGASTAGYRLFTRMRADGIDLDYVNIVAAPDADALRAKLGPSWSNPDQLARVVTFNADAPLYGPQPRLRTLLQEHSADVMVGIGYIAALLMKRAYPERPLVFLTTGCQELKEAICAGRVRDLIGQQALMREPRGRPIVHCKEEREAVSRADLIVTHSDAIDELYRFFHWDHAGRVYNRVIWFSDWIYEEANEYGTLQRPFAQRDIEVCCVASSWARPEKNPRMVGDIAAALRGTVVHVAGEDADSIAGVERHGLITTRRELFDLLGRSKTVVSTSLFDAAPGVLFEASAMGCNVVTSRNCGNWQLCDPALLADPYSAESFVACIERSSTAARPGSRDTFRKTGSYADLIETLQVM